MLAYERERREWEGGYVREGRGDTARVCSIAREVIIVGGYMEDIWKGGSEV